MESAVQPSLRAAAWLSVLIAALVPLLPTASAPPAAPAPAQPGGNVMKRYDSKSTLVAMRDGVKLYTAVWAPKDAKGPLPFILLRTPYSADGNAFTLTNYLKELAEEGYIFVFQDIRGRYKSEGQFVMMRPPRDPADAKAIDEGTDAHDTIEWALKNVPNNNGRVGMLGISYPGWLTVMAQLEPHPALKATSPQAPPADMFLGDDFHHNGAFRLSYGFEYTAMMETNKFNTLFKFDRHDTYEWYLNLGSLANVNAKVFRGKMPTWNDFVAHPNYDAFWKKQAVAPYLTRVTVPTLNVAGWWDQEDFYGPLKVFEELDKHDKNGQNHLVVGPWNHGGWSAGDGSGLGRIPFDSATGKYFREKVQAPWFAFHLKDKGDLKQPKALMFQTGSNRWVAHDSWPPRQGVTPRKLYFHADGKLGFDPPPGGPTTNFDSYVSDPARPVPYRPRPVTPTYPGPEWRVWLVEDQRYAHNRPDVLSYTTEPLTEDVTVGGAFVAHLFASTTGSDCDWVVKVIDVHPEQYVAKNPDGKGVQDLGGYQLMVSNEVFRARFRKSFEKPEPVVPNQVTEYTIDLHWSHHCFRKGHRIMVQVCSTWFPLIDRNPQKYVPNIFEARDTDFQPARMRVHRAPNAPSHVTVPVWRAPAK
jgi:putative CocE/NonD family hydrolase